MSTLYTLGLAQVSPTEQSLGWIVGAFTLIVGLVSFMVKWIASTFTSRLEKQDVQNKDSADRHAAQTRERDQLFAQQLDKFLAHMSKREEAFLAQVQRSDGALAHMSRQISRFDRTLAVQTMELANLSDPNNPRNRGKQHAERTIREIDEDERTTT